jgi:hypothetical protein
MKIILNRTEKEKYRDIEKVLFNKNAADPKKVIRKKFTHIQYYEHSLIGQKELFEELKSKFGNSYSEFCIATVIDSEPIYLIDLKKDTLNHYYGVLNSPKIIGLEFPDPDVGLSITNEKLFFYNTQQHWCLYADRYNDLVILGY